jgi:hypothetical protein
MATKSVLNIVEDALVVALATEADLSAYNKLKGQSVTDIAYPSIIVACENASYPPGLAQGLGNYLCKVSVGIFTQIDTSTLTAHRTAVQNTMGVLDTVATVKAAFVSLNDGTAYDTTLTSMDEGRGDRAFVTTLNYDVLMVLPSV